MLKYNFLKFLSVLIFFSSCAYFEDEEDIILPGKRESIYSSEGEALLKVSKKVIIDKPKNIETWSQQHQNIKNHLSHFKSNSVLKVERKIDLEGIIFKKSKFFTPPIIVNNIIYYSDNDYKIIAKNLINGRTKWKFELKLEKSEKFPLIAGFFLEENKLLFSSGLGNLYCIDITSGKVLWLKKFGVQFTRPPVLHKNKIFLVSDDNQLFAVDKNSKEILWSHLGNIEELSIIGGSKPVVDQGMIVVSYSSGEIFALDEETGSVIWFDNISTANIFAKTSVNDIQSPICIESEKLYVPTFSNKFLAYNLKNGKKTWDIKLSSINPITISGETIYLIDINNRLIGLDKATGKLLWAVQLKSKENKREIIWSGPLLTSNKLLVLSSTGLILSLSPFTGKTLSKIKYKEKFITSPIQTGGKVYLISEDGILYILS